MKTSSILVPLFKKIDKIVFGFEDTDEIERQAELPKPAPRIGLRKEGAHHTEAQTKRGCYIN